MNKSRSARPARKLKVKYGHWSRLCSGGIDNDRDLLDELYEHEAIPEPRQVCD